MSDLSFDALVIRTLGGTAQSGADRMVWKGAPDGNGSGQLRTTPDNHEKTHAGIVVATI